MSEQFSKEVAVSDPLSEVTRTERKLLLAVSALGILIVKTGLVPSKISALGIEFAQTDQRALLRAIGAIVLYFLFAFLVYAISDLMAWRFKYHNAARFDFEYRKKMTSEPVTILVGTGRTPEEARGELKTRILLRREEVEKRQNRAATAMSIFRALIEYILPVLIASYAITLLWTHRP